MDNITNKVAASGIITINPEDFVPVGERVLFDMKPHLLEELLLKEKDFREFVKNEDWSRFQDKYVAITCTNDAIIPVWAFMLVTVAMEPFAKTVVYGDLLKLEEVLFYNELQKLDPLQYADQRVVIKGCGDKPVPEMAYIELTRMLTPVVKSIMYGEPCSTVPVFKRK
jgi:hypothetical protein